MKLSWGNNLRIIGVFTSAIRYFLDIRGVLHRSVLVL
jgi:hypothetical protein